MLIIEDFLLHPRHQLPTLQSIACKLQSTTGYTALTPTATCMCPLLYKPCCLSCWRPYDHLGHRCWSKLVPNLLLKLCQSLTNFYPNLTTFSKNNKLVIPSGGSVVAARRWWQQRGGGGGSLAVAALRRRLGAVVGVAPAAWR